MERGEGAYQPEIELVTNKPEYKFGDKVRFRDKDGQELKGEVVGNDHDQLRVIELLPDGTRGPISAIPLESVIHEADDKTDEDRKQSAA